MGGVSFQPGSFSQNQQYVDEHIDVHGLSGRGDDLVGVTEAIRGMNEAQNDEVFGAMTPERLRQWADQVYDPGYLYTGVNGGLSDAQRHALFDAMASKFDGETLARVASQFDRESGDLDALTEAIERGTPQQKRDFIVALGRDIDGRGVRVEEGFNGQPNEMAQAAGRVWVSLKSHPQEFNEAARALDRQGKLDEVLVAASGLWSHGLVYDYKPQLLKDLVGAVNAQGDRSVRGSVSSELEQLRLDIQHVGWQNREGTMPPQLSEMESMVRSLSDSARRPALSPAAAGRP